MYGKLVVIDDRACITREWKQYKFPKSKKRRIRKKWEKRSANFKTVNVHRVVNTNDKLFVSSLVFEKLKG